MSTSSLNQFLEGVQKRDPHQSEYLQAVREVLESLWPFIERHPRYADDSLLERLIEPERVVQFRGKERDSEPACDSPTLQADPPRRDGREHRREPDIQPHGTGHRLAQQRGGDLRRGRAANHGQRRCRI